MSFIPKAMIINGINNLKSKLSVTVRPTTIIMTIDTIRAIKANRQPNSI